MLVSAFLIGTVSTPAHLQPVPIVPPPPVYDDAGRPLLLLRPAHRVVTLAPALTELVYAAGAHEHLVGVSAYSDFPEMARYKPKVADATGISFEALLALKPELVLAWKGGTRAEDIARLGSLGINVFVIEIRSLADVSRAIRVIGKLVDLRDGDRKAREFAAIFDARLEKLQVASKTKSRVRVFFQISQMPLMTVNGEHFISETMKLCGGENVFADVAQTVVEPSREALLRRGADAILRPASIHKDATRDDALYGALEAYRSGRVYSLNADWVLRPGPRVLLAADEICAALERARTSMASAVKSTP
jgi:iron complex transport system substrate-binding protein